MSYKKFLDKITKLLEIHAPLTKLIHKDKISLSKSWLTIGMLQSIKQRNVLHSPYRAMWSIPKVILKAYMKCFNALNSVFII